MSVYRMVNHCFPDKEEWNIESKSNDPWMVEPLDPVGNDYLEALKSNKYQNLINEVKQRTGTLVASSSSSSSSSSSNSSSSSSSSSSRRRSSSSSSRISSTTSTGSVRLPGGGLRPFGIGTNFFGGLPSNQNQKGEEIEFKQPPPSLSYFTTPKSNHTMSNSAKSTTPGQVKGVRKTIFDSISSNI